MPITASLLEVSSDLLEIAKPAADRVGLEFLSQYERDDITDSEDAISSIVGHNIKYFVGHAQRLGRYSKSKVGFEPNEVQTLQITKYSLSQNLGYLLEMAEKYEVLDQLTDYIAARRECEAYLTNAIEALGGPDPRVELRHALMPLLSENIDGLVEDTLCDLRTIMPDDRQDYSDCTGVIFDGGLYEIIVQIADLPSQLTAESLNTEQVMARLRQTRKNLHEKLEAQALPPELPDGKAALKSLESALDSAFEICRNYQQKYGAELEGGRER